MSLRVLILMDARTLPYLLPGAPPAAPFSHDKNLFQFAHEALRRGWTVLVTPMQQDARARPAWQVQQVYPVWQQNEEAIRYDDLHAHIVVAVSPEALNVREHFPDAKIVAIHAAVQWVESAALLPAQYVFDAITAVRYNIDSS